MDLTGPNTWADDEVFVILGQSGDGRIILDASSSPRIQLIQQGTNYNDQTEQIRIGDLNGNWNYSAETWGIAIGEYGSGKANIIAENGNLKIRNYTTDILRFASGGNNYIDGGLQLGTSGALYSGATAFGVGTGWWMDAVSGGRFYLGNSYGNHLSWNGSTLDIAGDGSGITSIDGGNITTGTIDAARISVGDLSAIAATIASWTINSTTLANGTNIILDAVNKAISLVSATFGAKGIQLQYNGGNPKFYVGDGANNYLKFESNLLSWKAANSQLDTSGNLTASNVNLTGVINATTGDLGDLSVSGSLALGTGGILKSGATGYNSGTGWWLDYNGGTPRFFIGNSGGNKLTWSGSVLTLVGNITATGGSITGTLSMGASGKITAGNVTVDTNGMKILTGAVVGSNNSVLFNDGTNNVGYLTGYTGGAESGLLLEAFTLSARVSAATIKSAGITSLIGPTVNLQSSDIRLGSYVTVADNYIKWSADTNLYRSAANMLKTDDNFTIGGAYLYLGADVSLYRASANVLRTDDAFFGNTTISAVGQFQRYAGSAYRAGTIYVPLLSALTSTSFDGDTVNTGNYTVSISGFSGYPSGLTGVKAWHIRLVGKPPAAGDAYYLTAIDPTAGANSYGCTVRATGSYTNEAHGIVHCNSSGQIQLTAGGGNWTGVHIQVLGYFL